MPRSLAFQVAGGPGEHEGCRAAALHRQQVYAGSHKNPVLHERSKHIDVRFHFIRDCINNGTLETDYVRTGDQLVDLLTKPLPRERLQELRIRSSVINVGATQHV